jgi:hypothetical protein
MNRDLPKPLEYFGRAPAQQPRPNIPATISIGCGIAAAIVFLSMLIGIWTQYLPSLARNAGWICGALAVVAIINGALGALEAERDSTWYRVALLGYALGILLACLTPLFYIV